MRLAKNFLAFFKIFLFSPKRKKAPTNKTACYGDLFVGASRFSGLTRRLLPEWTCNGIYPCDALSTATRNVVIPHEIVLIVVRKSFSRRRICIAPLASPADPPTDRLRSAFRAYDLYISLRIPVYKDKIKIYMKYIGDTPSDGSPEKNDTPDGTDSVRGLLILSHSIQINRKIPHGGRGKKRNYITQIRNFSVELYL